MADDIGSRGEDPRDVARRRLNIGRRLREGQARAAQSQTSGPSVTPSTRSMVPYRESLPAGGGRGGGGEGGGGGRSMAPSSGDRMPMSRPSSGELMRQGAGMGGGAPRAGGPRVVGGAGPAAAAGLALGLGSEALRRYMESRGERPIRGEFEQGMEPEGTPEAAAAETERQRNIPAPAPAPRPAPRSQPARRPAPRPREMSPEERQAFMERTMREEADREAAARQPERGFFERLGLRRTNETGMEPGTIEHRRNYLGSGATDTNTSYNKKGGLLKAKAPMKKGGKAMMYREGGKVRQGMQSPKAQEARAEMAEDVMKRSMSAEPKRRMRDMMSPEDRREYDAPLTPQERERMRSSGFKKGGMIKPKTAMKKGGVVKKAAGGKIAAPKKMMKGGMTSKPKKMMGGGRAMYAKGGMAKGRKK